MRRSWIKKAILLACASTSAVEGVCARVAPAYPEITPVAILPRDAIETLGWYSAATVDGGFTTYSPWTYDADAMTYSTSSTWFRRCGVGSTCSMWTGCSNGYLVGPSASSSCGAGGAAGSLFCSNHVLYTSKGANKPYSWYWCDTAPLTGSTFYEQQPSQPPTSSTPASTDATTTSSPTSSFTPSQTSASPLPTTSSDSSSSNVGAIAGGVVGGFLGVALIGVGAFFLWRRNREKKNIIASTPGGYAPPPNQAYPNTTYPNTVYPASPNMVYAAAYQANESKPVGVQEAGSYYGQPQQGAYPQGPYDPYMSQYGGSPPPGFVEVPTPQTAFAAPGGVSGNTPQELPSSPVRK
ncbi:hypothetical protein P280DRAFT_550515 [Massarina eburnea CBS 473.64]|uniref:Epidermal growth factor receptor-like transmembrane-juxtamembrane segment domain-containing protein n=1 Tax=Massarina eburnea CBS 473.64 TaxID=1395130 RepID=A0A6A6RZG0_9PLEO|nr:hypothetical protein P280DRAFT_550515 [Massarina eburnea CBS 473.64]